MEPFLDNKQWKREDGITSKISGFEDIRKSGNY